MDKRISNITFGQAAEHRVMSELLMRNIIPLRPAADIAGCDMVTDAGIRIQVKATRLLPPTGHKRLPHYSFELRCTRPNGLHKLTRFKRQFSAQCDFVVLWGADEDRFWVVPAAILDGCGNVHLSPIQRWKEADTEGIRADRKSGMSYRQISEKHGVSSQIVWDRVNLDRQQAGRVANLVRQHENRWDLLAGCAETLEEANEAVSVTQAKDQEK
jgi:hypothetical protein